MCRIAAGLVFLASAGDGRRLRISSEPQPSIPFLESQDVPHSVDQAAPREIHCPLRARCAVRPRKALKSLLLASSPCVGWQRIGTKQIHSRSVKNMIFNHAKLRQTGLSRQHAASLHGMGHGTPARTHSRCADILMMYMAINRPLDDEGGKKDKLPALGSDTTQLPSAATRTPQVLRLRDAVTQQEISIVGTFHDSAFSVKQAREEIARSFKKENPLGAVVVELCQTRWDIMLKDALSKDDLSKGGENIIAGCVALQNGVPVMLGDAEYNQTLGLARQRAKQTLRDMIDPFGGGWQSIADDFSRTLPSLFDTSDIAKSDLLLDGEVPLSSAAGASLVFRSVVTDNNRRNFPLEILALVTKGVPIVGLSFVIFNVLLVLETSVSPLSPLRLDIVSAVVFEIFLLVPMFRLLLVTFLEERNTELARSIRRAAQERNAPVVAILGATHVNSVARLLMSEQALDADDQPSQGVWLQECVDSSLMQQLPEL